MWTKPFGYCWRTPQGRKSCVPHAFFEGKKAGETSPRKSTPRTLKEVGQQYPCWVGTRRVALPYVSSCPPLKTVRTTFMVYGLTPAVILRDPRSVPSHFASSTGLHPWTACAFAGYLWSGLSAG